MERIVATFEGPVAGFTTTPRKAEVIRYEDDYELKCALVLGLMTKYKPPRPEWHVRVSNGETRETKRYRTRKVAIAAAYRVVPLAGR